MASSAARAFGGNDAGWTYYSPYATKTVVPVSTRVVQICAKLDSIFIPLAALSSAAFMILLERQVRRAAVRGFTVEAGGESAGQ